MIDQLRTHRTAVLAILALTAALSLANMQAGVVDALLPWTLPAAVAAWLWHEARQEG